MNDLLKQIVKMHQQFNIDSSKVAFTKEEKQFRIKCLKEEIKEYSETTDKAEELDAMVDLVVFALGTVERQGLIGVFEEAFTRVMKANCAKQLGGNAKRGNFQIDLVKPEGWIAPDHSDLVRPVQLELGDYVKENTKQQDPASALKEAVNLIEVYSPDFMHGESKTDILKRLKGVKSDV